MAGRTTESSQTEDCDYDVIIIGAGAAGLLAAGTAARRGRRTLLLEKNTKPGVKILMSGGTRCNLTHDTDERGIIAAFGRNGRFLHAPLAALGPRDLVRFFHDIGVPTKIEATGKVFPLSDKALDVQQALTAFVRTGGAELRLRTSVSNVGKDPGGYWRVELEGAKHLTSESVIVTVGGMSYPGCGTTGDGYPWARSLGHHVITPYPALTPLIVKSPWVRELAGVTLARVSARVVPWIQFPKTTAREKQVGFVWEAEQSTKRSGTGDAGGFLFTHFGVSGPVPMNVSHDLTHPDAQGPFGLVCDWMPGETQDATTGRLQQQSRLTGSVGIGQLLSEALPRRLVDHLLFVADVNRSTRLAEISKTDLRRIAFALHRFVLPLDGTKGFAKAEVTAGGVDLTQINSSDMSSKLHERLYFAGEILDLDGPIGGYNFQSAFSTGYLAGLHA